MIINGNGNVYEQIVNYYRKYIKLGIIAPGEKLPSCRELAIEIGVNHKTVERAFSELSNEGLIESIPKKGYFVCGKKEAESLIYNFLIKLKSDGVTKEEILEEVNKIFEEERE